MFGVTRSQPPDPLESLLPSRRILPTVDALGLNTGFPVIDFAAAKEYAPPYAERSRESGARVMAPPVNCPTADIQLDHQVCGCDPVAESALNIRAAFAGFSEECPSRSALKLPALGRRWLKSRQASREKLPAPTHTLTDH